jgi:hypothetical protein
MKLTYCLCHIVYLLGILFDPENKGNTGEPLADYTASYSEDSIHDFFYY